MANNRMWLKCVGCGERHLLAKRHGSWGAWEGDLDTFLDEHTWCRPNVNGQWGGEDFALEFEQTDADHAKEEG